MARVLGFVGAALVLGIGAFAIYVFQTVSTVVVVQVTEDVHKIEGLGSNVGVLRTDDGAIVVDTMTFAMQGREIRERAEALAGPVQLVVNTHYHLDHTHGNPSFAGGLPIVSTQKTLAYLKALDSEYWQGAAAETLPNLTFEDEHVIRMGGKTVRLLHPGRGHTDGDLVALFVEDRVLHTGDLFFNGQYPNIDLEAGGSVQEWSATIDRILSLEGQFDQIIPGHGPITDASGLRQFQHFMQQLAVTGTESAAVGRDLADHKLHSRLDADAGYDVMSIPFVLRLDRDFVLERAWQEATGNFERVALE